MDTHFLMIDFLDLSILSFSDPYIFLNESPDDHICSPDFTDFTDCSYWSQIYNL